MPPRLSRVPEVFDALVDLIRADPDIDEVAVLDGPRRVNDYRPYVIMVGFRPGSDSDISATREAPGGHVSNDIETITIGLVISAHDGNGVVRAARDLAAAKLAVVERIITTNIRLGLSGVKAILGPSAWQQMPTEKGFEVSISQDITVEAL